MKAVTTAIKTSKFRTSLSVNSVKQKEAFLSNNFKTTKPQNYTLSHFRVFEIKVKSLHIFGSFVLPLSMILFLQ